VGGRLRFLVIDIVTCANSMRSCVPACELTSLHNGAPLTLMNPRIIPRCLQLQLKRGDMPPGRTCKDVLEAVFLLIINVKMWAAHTIGSALTSSILSHI
jgi:hypothetical protein